MAIRFDDAARRLELSVGDLLAEESFRRIGFERGEGFRRMWLGQALHSRYQNSQLEADPAYCAEVWLTHEIEVSGWIAKIRGRLDGCFTEAGGTTVVEEIKSLHFATELSFFLGSERLRLYKRQLQLYCHFFAAARQVSVRGRLVLLDIATPRQRLLDIETDPAEIEGYLVGRLRVLVANRLRAQTLLRKRALMAGELPFPHPALRPHQETILADLETALAEGSHLMINAPTGSGKTAVALFAAARFALSANKRVFFLTSKTLQQDIAVATLKRFAGFGVRSLRLRAKAKMCANTQIICHEDFCEYAAEYAAKVAKSRILERLAESFPHLEPDTIFAEARHQKVCPFEVSLELVPQVDVIVGDYNYVFDPFVALRDSFEGEAAEGAVVIVDEAHNLIARARGYYSPELGGADLEGLRRHLESQAGEVHAALGAIVLRLQGEIERLAEEFLLGSDTALGGAESLAEIDRAFFDALRADLDPAILAYMVYRRENELYSEDDPVMDFFFLIVRFHMTLGLAGEEFSTLVSREKTGLRLKILCKDAARFLAAIVARSHSTIAMSATLAPIEFYRRTLGFPADRTASVDLPSPFPRHNRKILVIPQVDTTFRARHLHYGEIARIVADLATVTAGNSLALFPSYAFLREVQALLPILDLRVLTQRADAGDFERQQILTRLRETGTSGSLVLAVSGGIYSEGVDYPGAMLSAVFVISPSLPQFTFEQELLKQYYEEKYERGFDYAYLIPGLTRVVQSAGRLIRSETDTGLIALICRRFTYAQYSKYFPVDWYDKDPRELVARDYLTEASRFFAALRTPAALPEPKPS